MTPEAFAAERQARLTAGDEVLKPFVTEALARLVRGESDWSADLVTAASRIWFENFQAEAPGSPGVAARRRFEAALTEVLDHTGDRGEVTDAQISLVTAVTSTYAVNAGTVAGAFQRGIRFKMWVTMHDGDVRHIHAPLDGQVAPIGGTFDVAGTKLAYPGEPKGPLETWINCRCVAMPASREGEAMSANTYTIEPDDALDENPDIEVGYDLVAAAAEPDADGASNYFIEWTDEMGTRYYGPFDTRENAERWRESDKAPFDGESEIIGAIRPDSLAANAVIIAAAVVDETDIAVEPADEEDLPTDELDDEEELITEIPVHGVSIVEGKATGDGRGFRKGALEFDVPQPLGYEFEHGHGGDNSRVAIVGRIDEIFRKEGEGDEPNEIRWRGAIILTKEHAAEALESIIDGSYTGASVIVDDVTLDVEDMKAEYRRASEDGEGDFIDQMFGDGTQSVTWIAMGRQRRLDMVPTGAFPEAYVGLGHAFEDELTDEDRAALAACGCAESVDAEEFKDYPTESRKKMADSGSAMPSGQVREEALRADRLYATQNRVASKAQQAADGAGLVVVVNDQRGPGAAGAGVGAAHLGNRAADAALPALGLYESIELTLADPVLSAEGAVAAPHPTLVRDLDPLVAGLSASYAAEPAVGAAVPVPLVEVGVRTGGAAGAAGDRTLVLDGVASNSHASDVTRYREIDSETRKKMAKAGTAMDDGSYPIGDCEDLRNAIQAIGRAKDPEATKAHIRKRKSALGCDDVELPEDWEAETVTAAAGTHDGPGWITHPVPTARIRRYWVRGKGAAKIRWGAPGDFNRCRLQLAKYVQNPDWLAGMCANMHKEALGIWPATHAGKTRHAVTAGAQLVALESKRTVYDAALFERPELDHAAPVRIDRETRRIYGYLAQWGVCHVGISGMCQTVPASLNDYAYFLKGRVATTAGDQRVGTLTYGIGHANTRLRAAAATAHYDQTDAVRAFVNMGEDTMGVWFSGVMAPWTTEADMDAIEAIGAFSGDWRDWGQGSLDLVGAVCVNTPGFQLVAAGGVQTAMIGTNVVAEEKVLVAAGSLKPDEVAAIARTAVAEYRHQQKVEASVEPARARVRAHRLAAARARVEKGA